MPAAIVAAVGLTGVAATVATVGLQLGLSYAANKLLAPSSPGGDNAAIREQQYTGGDSADKFIFGRAKVGGVVTMLQKYNGFIYYGIAITRQHRCQEIEAIYLGDKLSTHSDYSNAELSSYRVDFSDVTGGDGTLAAVTDIAVTIDGNATVYAAQIGDTLTIIRDGLLSQLPDTSTFEFSAEDSAGVASLVVKRIAGSVANWDTVISVGLGSAPQDLASAVVQTAGAAESDYVHRILTSLGDDVSASADLVAELDFPDVPQRFTAAHIGQRVTWVNVRWPEAWLKDNLGRIPPVVVVLKGNKDIDDPRDGSSGYSTNAALCARWTAQKTYSLNASQLPGADWIAAANVCDEDVTITGGVQKRYAVNGVVSTSSQPVDRLKLFSDSMQAPFMRRGHEILIRPAAYQQPLIHLDENDLAGNVTATFHPSTSGAYNWIQGVFINPDQEWQSHDYPSVYIDDGLREKVGNLSFQLEIDPIRAQRLAQLNLVLQSNAASVQIHIKLLPDYIAADSMIALTYLPLGWVGKTFYVDSRDDNFDHTAVLVLLPRETSQYSWDASDAVPVDSVSSQSVFAIRDDLL